ncbi:Ribonuclease [Paramixta manurensis]|uniref:Ribonuclease n=1 Tax=Paramixta manurensis TaxID=2740817 RepID=A0A6M8U905_9GAMM|nr:Ribonuclease [Erwiniaceae bacterium PD-1]
MFKLRWIALIVVFGAAVVGLKPHFSQWYQTGSTPHQADNGHDISDLTQDRRVVEYLRQHQRLPAYYVTKREARRQGWQPGQGDLCATLPGKAIGGDRFANREGRLPSQRGRQWYEADVNYRCGYRNTDRLLYSDDGLIFLTRDHYRSFTRMQ